MTEITKAKYEYALRRIEELLPLVSNDMAADDLNGLELDIMAGIVKEYEDEYYPIGKPTVAALIACEMEEKHITQKELAQKIGVSQSRISDFVSGKAEPSLKIASSLCKILNISPYAMLGV